MIDLLAIDQALDAATLGRIRGAMRAAERAPATELGSAPGHMVTSSARKVTRVAVSAATRDAVVGRLEALRPRIAAHFGGSLDAVEEPQFLCNGPGDYFVAHQDGNTPLVYDESRFRKVTVVIFLSTRSEEPRPGTFCGGSLVLRGPLGRPHQRLSPVPAPSRLVAFRSERTHEVLPITHGERLSVVAWYRGP